MRLLKAEELRASLRISEGTIHIGEYVCDVAHARRIAMDILELTDTPEAADSALQQAQATIQRLAQEREERYDAEAEWQTLLSGLLTPDETAPQRERALAFLRVWANSFLLKGNVWDVPRTMGAALNQVIRILEQPESSALILPLQALVEQMRRHVKHPDERPDKIWGWRVDEWADQLAALLPHRAEEEK